MSNASSSSFTEPYAAQRSGPENSNSSVSNNQPPAINQPAISQPAFNQSPEQHFKMSLLPGHTQPVYSPLQPLPIERLNQDLTSSFMGRAFAEQTDTVSKSNFSAEIAALHRQQAAICKQMQQQERITSERLKGLRHQLDRQETRHKNEILCLTNDWKRQLADLETSQTDNAQSRSEQRRDIQRPEQTKSRYKKSPLQSISNTYQVPARAQTRWVDRSLGAIPVFIWLVVIGLGIAGASAIALSPGVLWPSFSIYIRAAIPLLFVMGLLGLGITAVWDTFR